MRRAIRPLRPVYGERGGTPTDRIPRVAPVRARGPGLGTRGDGRSHEHCAANAGILLVQGRGGPRPGNADYVAWLASLATPTTTISSSYAGALAFVVDAVHIDALGLNTPYIARHGTFDPDGSQDSKTAIAWIELPFCGVTSGKPIHGAPRSTACRAARPRSPRSRAGELHPARRLTGDVLFRHVPTRVSDDRPDDRSRGQLCPALRPLFPRQRARARGDARRHHWQPGGWHT